MKMINKVLTMIIAASSLMLFSCDEDETPTVQAPKDTAKTTSAKSSATVSFTNLGDLATDSKYEYEGWLLIDGAPVSTGKFREASKASFTFDSVMAAKATKYILTLEPATGDVPAPSALKILAGDITSGNAAISTKTGPALGAGADFSTAAGTYAVTAATATAAQKGMTSYQKSGIWFLKDKADQSGKETSLTLPTLGSDWVYEGWIVLEGKPYSTGRFTDLSAADDAAPYSGDEMAPPFPGEDFLKNAPTGVTFPLDASAETIVISVEPAMDSDPAPFFYKPLMGTGGTLDNKVSTLPTGTIAIK